VRSPLRIVVDSQNAAPEIGGDLFETILAGLLSAQRTWLVTQGDPAALRRALFAVLGQLG